jgi:hypothetical protein
MNNKKSLFAIVFSLLIISSAILIGCQKESKFGFDLLPAEDTLKVKITDTLSVTARTIVDDSVSITGVSYLLFGCCNDPIFGRTTASFVTELRLETTNSGLCFGVNPKPDSIFLFLPYQRDSISYFGNKEYQQHMEIFDLNQNLLRDSNYISRTFDITKYAGSSIATKTFAPWEDQQDSVLKIKLPMDYAQKILNIDSISLQNDTSFRKTIKGIYVKASEVQVGGAIVKFEISSSNSYVKVYYHNQSNDSLSSVFYIDGYSTRMNLFKHNYSGTNIEKTLKLGNNVQDSVVYIQSMAGLKAQISFPFLEEFNKTGPIAISRAELIVKTESPNLTLEGGYPINEYLNIFSTDGKGNTYYIPEYQGSSGAIAVGRYNDEYHYDIANFIQKSIDRKIVNYKLFLQPSYSVGDFYRTVITSGRHTSRMKIVITYVKI